MQLSSAELIVTIVFAIVGLLMGFVSGAMPLQPQRMTPAQATAQKVLGFAIVAVVVALALASMNVAMWTTLIAVALGIAIANVPVIRRAVTTRIAWFAPNPTSGVASVAVADGRYAACCCRPRILIWLGPDSRMTVWPQPFCRNRLSAGSIIPR